MTRRVRSDDLDHLLDLVEKNRMHAAHGPGDPGLDLQHSSPLWSSNHEFWLEQLKQETSDSWSEQQYTDAANLINFAEYQRVVLNDFMEVLAGPANDIDIAATEQSLPAELVASGDRAPASDDQIQLRTEFSTPPDRDDSGDASSARDTNEQAPDHDSANSEHNRSGRADLAAICAIRSHENGSTQFNQIRADLYVQTGLTSLRPYSSWDDFQERNNLSDDLVSDLQDAYPDGFEAVDMWVAGLAEVAGSGAAGSTLQAAINEEVGRLHKASAELSIHDLAGTAIFTSIESQSYASIVQRHSGVADGNQSVAPDQNGVVSTLPVNAAAETRDQVISGTDDNDIIYGGAGDDLIYGGAGDDLIIGGKGHDKLHGGHGADHLKGGAGDDSLSGDDGDDNLDGGTGSDDLHGGYGADLARGRSGDDQLYGGAGDDTLDGGDGADIMDGGLGNDTIYVDDHCDQAIEAAGEGTDTVRTNLTVYTLPENIEILIYAGDSNFIGTGNELANFIIGGDGDDTLAGGGGDDVLIGGQGADLLIGGLGSDVIILTDAKNTVIENAGEGTDTVATTLNSYALAENVEVLVFIGNGSFTGNGNALDNIITGGDGNDTLHGGEGHDTLYGGDGDDTLDGGDGDDSVAGGQGSDFVMFTRGSDTLVLRQGFGNDVVIGFDTNSSGQGSHDRIDVSSYGFHEDALGIDILLIYDGESTTVKIGADSVRLVLVDVNNMDRHDFIFS